MPWTLTASGPDHRSDIGRFLEDLRFEEAPDVVDAVLGVEFPAFGNVAQPEVPVGGRLPGHRDDRAVRVGDLGGTQTLALDVGDDPVQPVDGLAPAGDRAFDEPRLRVIGHADVELGATGVGFRETTVSEHPVREHGA